MFDDKQYLKPEVIKQLVLNDGEISKACSMSGIGRTTFYAWLKKDKVFKTEVRHTLELLGNDKVIAQVAAKNAMGINT